MYKYIDRWPGYYLVEITRYTYVQSSVGSTVIRRFNVLHRARKVKLVTIVFYYKTII